MKHLCCLGAALSLVFLACVYGCAQVPSGHADPAAFVVDPYWPKPLANNWILGQVAGIAVDFYDHV